jgi:hypothetical protein
MSDFKIKYKDITKKTKEKTSLKTELQRAVLIFML